MCSSDLCSTVLTLFLVLFPLFQFQILRFPNFLPTPFLAAIGVAAALNFSIVAMMGILITHRVAGPMFSLVRRIRQVQAGSFQAHLRLRETDDLKYLVRNFNEMIDYLAETTQNDRDRVGEVLAKLKAGAVDDAIKLGEDLKSDLAARLGDQTPPEATHGATHS